MALALTSEHTQLAEAVRAWAQRHSPAEVVRAAAGDPDGGTARYRETLRPGLAEQGLLGLHVPEADDGQGFGLAELTVAIEELGLALVPGGFVPTVLASAALVAAGVTGQLVSRLATGEANGAVALSARLRAAGHQGHDLIVTGSADAVPGAPGAELIILPVQLDSGITWIAADAAGLTITPAEGLDLTRQLGRVEARDLLVPPDRQLTGLAAEQLASLAAVLLGAEAAGLANWAVQTAAGYARMRHQFGRPIGQFQAVKHRCARMLVAAEQAAAAVWDAARALDAEGPGADYAVAAAAVLAADAAVSCAHECIQVLGGIGYTWEHEAHLYFKRARATATLLGSPAWQRERLVRLIASGAAASPAF
jgi:alkylation response protein AidB-like acyl-CoA dehydrogenase